MAGLGAEISTAVETMRFKEALMACGVVTQRDRQNRFTRKGSFAEYCRGFACGVCGRPLAPEAEVCPAMVGENGQSRLTLVHSGCSGMNGDGAESREVGVNVVTWSRAGTRLGNFFASGGKKRKTGKRNSRPRLSRLLRVPR